MHKMYCKEEDITHGQRYLLNLMDSRELSSFWQMFKNEYSFEYFFYAATGKFSIPSYSFILKLKDYINPILWFYRESDKISEDILSKPVVYFTESKNFVSLQKMQTTELWKLFVIENNSKNLYQSTVPIIKGSRIINCAYIKRLDAVFHLQFPIENWFIAP